MSKFQKSYYDVVGLCCSSEVPLIENILKPLQGIKEVSVIVPSRTVIVVHDSLVISQLQIVKALNQARLEANIRVYGDEKHEKRWPSPYSVASGLLLLLSFLKFVYLPLKFLALGAVAAGAFPIILKAIVSIRNVRFDINILVIIAVIGTIAMEDYLEAGTIVFLYSIAEWLESRASHKANAVMSSLMNMTPQKAVIAETGEVVDADEVKINTILAVKAGEVIPIDGVVLDGNCEIDEKTLTGESYPVAKQKDSTVWAGTINLNGYISVKTTALAEDCVVAKMAKLVEEAQNSKTSTQRLIDKFAVFYTPAVVVISTFVAVIPLLLKLHNEKYWLHFALVVLVSACPCALILSTPVATFCAYTKAATSGLLIKGGHSLETLAKIKVMAFDKTGTITKGEFVVTNFQSLSDDIDLNTLLYWVSSIESKSSHPLAEAIVDHGRSLSIKPNPEKVTEFENFPGEGICGKIDERVLYIGNKKIARRAGSETEVPTLQGEVHEGKTTGYIYLGPTPVGIFSLSDVCRSGVQEAIRQLKLLGIKTAMLTGDCQSAAVQAQEQLGHALESVHAELLPEDKVKIISEFKKEGPTAMLGDGLNDAPALATADIGISMGISGSALASETGDIILMSNDLRKIPEAIKLARKSQRKVIENIVLSVITKVAILGLAIGGHPIVWAAVLADVGTCLLVILNSMLLLQRGHKHGGKSCKSSTQHHIHKNTCGDTNGSPSHHHHQHKHQHQHQHHSHKSCCSDKAQPQKCATKSCSSKHPPCLSNPNGSINHHKITENHGQCKGSEELHESDHHHHGKCDKNHNGVQKHDIESKCCSESHNLILNTEDIDAALINSHGNCLGHKSHGTKHCHNENINMVTHHDSTSLGSPSHLNPCGKKERHQSAKHCHSNHGHENLKDHGATHVIHHQKSSCHSDIKKHGTGEISIDIINEHEHEHEHEHDESASKHGCSSLADKENDSRKDCFNTCCRNEEFSKESIESSIVHACISLDKREVNGCCKSYMKECCSKHGHSGGGSFVGGLSEIITE
ncbi:putative inactive cadmium/zinc-transporting ATPase HMA3 [Cicer arietinum]|uniref:Inactive cadmium/zinc-transporting ATPase HMA3 n=1 Tax=Cicer arietinum TaxID=3827 RepID=A0A1S3EDE3_CICAR|nr:putative inactive cadmium/zinc-transporting ATPase HMA3 [Cicer arietinum]XP_012573400.1 putative inactive cadmium/zinc-transporting ATPase HMA3 [Cicer arietinum]XP_012573401.1 putative inactive cadmium/zinc-transporting ATPase HMA3 [Cicer arietinum]